VKEKAKKLLIDKDKHPHPHPPARRLSVILVMVKSMNGLVQIRWCRNEKGQAASEMYEGPNYVSVKFGMHSAFMTSPVFWTDVAS